MNDQPFAKPPRWWSPKLSPRWVRLWRPVRMREQLRKQRLTGVDVIGAEHVRQAVALGQGVLITPNHASHADCFSLYGAGDAMQMPFYVMVAWQVFGRSHWLRQLALRHHGCFSVDREGTDMQALRQTREVLQARAHPLVMFPEGEVYHVNDRVTPFRDGPAAVALMAAKKSQRPVVCIPCAMKYRYVQDPTPELLELMDKLERALYWCPRPDLTLAQRIYHVAEGLLALKEVEFFGHTNSGRLPERIANLIGFLLARAEAHYAVRGSARTVPERVKAARRAIIDRLQEVPADSHEAAALNRDLDGIFLVVQAFSYPGDYVADSPTVERMAETLDKFEEDVLGLKTASIRGSRHVTVVFGEPISVTRETGTRMSAASLTNLLESRVQALLDAQTVTSQAEPSDGRTACESPLAFCRK